VTDLASGGALEDFIAVFNRFEAEAGLFDLRDEQGFPWWDLVRYQVQHLLCAERGIYGDRNRDAASNIGRALSLVRQCKQLTRDLARVNLQAGPPRKSLVVSSRKLSTLDDILAEDSGHGRAAIVVNKDGRAPAPHVAIAGQSLTLVTRIGARVSHPGLEIAGEIRRLANEISARFQCHSDLADALIGKYRFHLAAQRTWSYVLDRIPAVDRVVFVNDDTLKTLVFLARKRGIFVEEVQHGYMGRSHVAFSYPTLSKALETLPDRVIITRDTGDITYPVQRLVLQTPLAVAQSGPRDIDVLIGASPTLREETDTIVGALVGRGLRVAVKLHPTQTAASSGLRERFFGSGLEIHAGSEDFCALARRASVYVPANPTSTTTFEAVENGARLIVVDFNGTKKTAMNDGTASARAASVESLAEVVFSQLRKTGAIFDESAGQLR